MKIDTNLPPTPAKQKQAGFRNYATNEGVMFNCWNNYCFLKQK